MPQEMASLYGRAAESAPVDGLGADAQAIVVALEREILAASAMAQLDVGAELLSPIAGNAAADGEDTESGLLEILLGEVIEIEEGIEADQLASLFGALAIVQGEVESDLGVGEGGDVDGAPRS